MLLVRPLFLGCALLGLTIGGCGGDDDDKKGEAGVQLGAPCGLAVSGVGPEIAHPSADCMGAWCVYGDTTRAPSDVCSSDAACNAEDPTYQRFACVSGRCELSQVYVAEKSRCSPSCEVDADCGGEVSSTSSCASGFRCVPLTTADFCCESVCVCSDDLVESDVEAWRSGCAMNPACE